uniref:Uncharacterized protein n=1 Tax=Panagrolaimus sp. PS1159 TaxID=55785 RepID=A0AC35EWF4_9BILA
MELGGSRIETDIDYEAMLNERYVHLPADYGSFNDTMHEIPDLQTSWRSRNSDAALRDMQNFPPFDEINDVLDSAILVKAAFETTDDEGNAPGADVITEDFDLLESAKLSDTLIPTFNQIDDGILVTLEKDFISDTEAYKRRHKFPQSFADEDALSITFDSLFVTKNSFNNDCFNVSNNVQSSIRPTAKPFAPLDESITRNIYYDHSSGFKDYDKLATKEKHPDFLFHRLVPKTLFRDTTSTFEPSQTMETDLRKLIAEFQEFLAQPENTPWQLNYDYTADTNVEDDGWDVKQLEEKNNLRNRFLEKHPKYSNNKEMQFLFQSLTSKVKLYPEGMYSQIKDDYHGGISFLNGAAPLDPNNLNPYLNHPSTEKYKIESNVPREPCTSTFPTHPGRKPLPSKLMTAPEIKEVKTGLPFELKPPRLPYECPRAVQEYTNHLVIRVALNRYISNNDDSLAHLILSKLLNARPDTFYTQESFRIFIHPARSMTHKEIQTLVRIANDYQCFDSSLHLLLAMDYFREKHFIGMEEEISNWCYSMRYSGMNKLYHPFPETADPVKASFKESSENVFTGERRCIVLTSCLYILNLNYQKARQLLKQLRQLDYEALEDEDLLHWTFTLDAQAQIGQVNPYAQQAKTFFGKLSDFFCMPTFETMHDLENLVDYFKTRLDNAKDGDATIPEIVKESNFRFLMMLYVYLQHHTLSSKQIHVKKIPEVFNSLCFVPFYDGKTRKLERVAKTLMRSYYLSTGNKEFRPQLSMVPESQLTRDSHEGYTVEGNIIETVMDAYEIAYTGKFNDALSIIGKLEIANMNGIIGCHNINIAKSCIEFDESFFTKSRINCEKKLSTLYDVCPLEALFRDVPYQILYGEINPLMIRQLYQVLGHSKSIEVLPSTQLRCYMALAQIFIELEKYRNGIDELTKALELSKKLNLLLFVSMIYRKLAVVYTCMNELPEACKAVEKCKAVQLNVNVPALETGMIYFAKYLIYRKANQHGNVKGVSFLPNYALVEYLMNAAKMLKPFTLIYKWLLVEELDFIVSFLNQAHSGPDVKHERSFISQHKEDFVKRFSHQFDLKDFSLDSSTTDLTKMAAEYKRKYSLPLYLI